MGLAHQSLVSPSRSFFLFSLFLSLFFFQDDSLEHRSFIGILCKPRKVKTLSLPFLFRYHLCHHPEGTPGSCWGWTQALYQAHLCMKCSLGISNFLEEISSLSHSDVFLYFFCIDP